jgi:hypothetical protein
MEQVLLLVVGLTQMVKDLFKHYSIPTEWLPLVATLIGTVFGYFIVGGWQGALTGTVVGLTTTGLVKKVDEYVKKDS